MRTITCRGPTPSQAAPCDRRLPAGRSAAPEKARRPRRRQAGGRSRPRPSRRGDRGVGRRPPPARRERSAPDVPRGAARRRAPRGDPGGSGDRAGHHRLRRDGFREDDPAPEDLPRGRARHGGPDRAHAAETDRRAKRRRPSRERARHDGRRRGRLQDPLQRSRQRAHLRQAHDRRHPARRGPARPVPERLRHDHHRRGARALAEHRLPARLPQAAPAETPRPQARHHVGDDRPRALLGPLRRRPDPVRRGAHLPGRASLRPARGRSRRRGRRPRRAGHGHGDRRRLRDAPRRAPARCPRVPVRGARDPRGGGPSRQARDELAPPSRRRHPAAVLATVERGAEPHLPAARAPAHRARDERRRDFPDRARHPRRRRHGPRADVPLQRPEQGAAATDRAHLPGLGRSAEGALRARGPGRLHPPLLGGGLRDAIRVHRARDPPDQPRRRHLADGVDEARAHRRLPVRRGAGGEVRQRRLPHAPGARGARRRARPDPARAPPRAPPRRPAPRAHAARRRRRGLGQRGADDRRGALDPGPARTSVREAPGGRRAARRVRRREVRLPDVAEPLELRHGAEGEPLGLALPEDVPPALPVGDPRARVDGRAPPARATREGARAPDVDDRGRPRRRPPRAPDRSPRQRRDEDRQAGLPRHEEPPPVDLPGLRAVPEGAEVDHGRRDRRDQQALGANRRHDRPRVDRTPGRAPARVQLPRRPLAEKAGHRRRLGAVDAVRTDRQPEEARELRTGQPGRVPPDLHPRGAGRRRDPDEGRLPPLQPGAARGGRDARGQVPPPRHRRRSRGARALLRRADPARRAHDGELRDVAQRSTNASTPGRCTSSASSSSPTTRSRSASATTRTSSRSRAPCSRSATTSPPGRRTTA